MAKFFELNTPNEPKVITREERILSDKFSFTHGTSTIVSTESNAPRQRIKMYIESLRYYDNTTDPVTDMYYRVGQYVEMETEEQFQVLTERGYVWGTYRCTENDGNGQYIISVTFSNANWSAQARTIILQDSFQNPEIGWLASTDPDNILDRLQVQKLPGVRRMDLTYATFLCEFTVSGWNGVFQLYDDDFLNIKCYANGAASRYIHVVPKGHAAIRTDTPVSLTYRDSGSLVFTTGTGKEFTAFTFAEKYPAPADTAFANAADSQALVLTGEAIGVDATVDDLGFPLLISSNTYHRGQLFWKAVDGYTYGIDSEFVMNGITTALYSIRCNIRYLGRNQTGVSPVPEASL